MKRLGFNPYLPSWEYIPDGEPHVFGNRVYIYGSHDKFNGHEYCPNDYVCYSASVDDLSDWKYEGVIWGRCEDPLNRTGESALFAPDVTQGPDGRYYLYYCLSNVNAVSVAVCDKPAGKYEFLGHVKYADGTLLGEAEGDEFQFDPGVLTENGVTYLYTGFCPTDMTNRHGAMCTVLEADMLTVKESPKFVVPSKAVSEGTGYEGHEYFEAPSIRKVGETYYLVYSSIWNHELCYATCDTPDGKYTYGGVVISNIDKGISSYKKAEQPMGYRDNNHGGFELINGKYYIFYHRHTNNYGYSRQGCLEPMEILEDGSIPQVEMTSCGSNGGPLPGEGYYPAYIVCNLYNRVDGAIESAPPGQRRDPRFPYVTQEGKDGDENPGFIENVTDGTIMGFKYFDCKSTRITKLQMRVCFSMGAKLEVALTPDSEAIGSVALDLGHEFTDGWGYYNCDIPIPDGVQALFFRLVGTGTIHFGGFYLQ